MKRKVFMLSILLPIVSLTFAQVSSNKIYFVKSNGDTTFCKSIYVERDGGNVYAINYTNEKGVKLSIDDCLDVKTYTVGSDVFDLIPLKASRPNGYLRHIWRKVDGKIKIYDYVNTISVQGGGSTSVVRYSVKMPEGKYYKINKKNLNKYIMPKLRECVDFRTNFKGEVSSKKGKFEKIIQFYNNSCAN